MCLQERQVYSRQTSPVNVFLSVWNSSPPHLGQLSLGVDFVVRGLTGLGNEGRGLDVGGEFGDGIEECAGELLDAEAGGGEKAVVHAHGVGCAVNLDMPAGRVRNLWTDS